MAGSRTAFTNAKELVMSAVVRSLLLSALCGLAPIASAKAHWRTDLYANSGTPMTHAEYIQLIKSFGAKFMPELMAPEVKMPFDGDYTQEMYSAQMFAEYKAAGISPRDVLAQTFSLSDILLWNRTEPDFAAQAVFLDSRYESLGFDPARAETWKPSMDELKAAGVKILAPPIYVLLALDSGGQIVASEYARAAKAAGLGLIVWSLERDGRSTRVAGSFTAPSSRPSTATATP
jgi:glycerophosphoryl diester phosphodiesterase